MLSGATFRAAAIVGTAVFRIVVSSDSMKNATATSHGNICLPAGRSGGNTCLNLLVSTLLLADVDVIQIRRYLEIVFLQRCLHGLPVSRRLNDLPVIF